MTATSAPMLAISDLRASYGRIEALKGVNIDVAHGEIVALIGANGAGKSTLMMTIFGRPRARSGRITFDGQDITRLSNHERCHLGMARTFQVPRPFSGSSVLDNVMIGALFGRAGRGLTAEQARLKAASTLQSVGLWDLRLTSPSR